MYLLWLFSKITSCTLIALPPKNHSNARSIDITTPPAVGYILHSKQTYASIYCIHIKLYFYCLINESNTYEKGGYMLIY